ncbi:hypothetical protein ACFE04_005962 [Oxalis oulophora]
MEASHENSIKIVEVTKISPSKLSAKHNNLIHLTCFDMIWIKFHPVERLFFYEFTSSSDFILHSLKHSLSLALSYYLPLAGQLTWGPHDPKPYILCSPTDSVSLVVAETIINADDDDDDDHNNFHKLCSKGNIVKATALRRYAPSLHISDEAATIISLQITFFPGFGFCIGIAAHHGVLDAKSTIMFMKSWAYLCQKLVLNQQIDHLLPANLHPHLDRTVIKDPTGKLDMFHLNNSLKLAARINPGGNHRSLRVLGTESAPDQVRATFDLSPQDINTIREKIMSTLNHNDDYLHLSSFTVTYAHAIVCFVKAKALENNVKINFLFSVDFRSRLVPPVPANYFGNCVGPDKMITLESKDIIGEEGLVIVARNISDSLKNLGKYGYFERVQEVSDSLSNCERSPLRPISPAGSHKLEVYGVDFGWGRPRKVDIVYIDQANSFSIAESRDKSGGIEIGLVMKNQVELQAFASLFL